ncbi:hypothetical protein [Leptodesmis sichuanensis]|uniref:hypothetical protein n=1 Tax=Leptodesmis sichuanensis TaxID=2906798 RepID=UPI001F28DA69|nr:hypothetical protein [Leptodesmis sichuanensis]UIE38403.1 hypothetical protein KIK02_01720 [Leptodesmis sichuanensis A121]
MKNDSADALAIDLQQKQGTDIEVIDNERLARHRHIKPNLLQMAMSLLETAMKVAKAEGKLLVSPKEQQERFRICLDCDQIWLPEEGQGGARCCECGCFIQWKASIKVADCPLGKWLSSLPTL